MDVSQADEVLKDEGRKFHLPGWMVQNIERLNAATDLDQYACSLLESDGYLPECTVDSSDRVLDVPSVSGDVEKSVEPLSKSRAKDILPELKFNTSPNKTLEYSPLSPKHHSVVDVIKCEEVLYSSPDTTPCVTPEPSPAPRRKVSFSSQDTVQSNPQKWFYLGTTRNSMKPKQLKKYQQQQSPTKYVATPNISDKENSTSVKLSISNFDLNAISPSSW